MSEPASSRIRRNTACVSCRDSKVKCDALTAGSQSCTRCAKLRIQCVVDRSHRRTSRRSKLEELAQEVRSIKEAVVSQPPASAGLPNLLPVAPMNSPPASLSSPASSRRSLAEPQPLPPRLLSPRASRGVADTPLSTTIAGRSPTEPRALNSRVFSSERIDFYFERFFEHFHPYLPIIRNRDPNQCYDAAPVLFWAIIATACRPQAPGDESNELQFLVEHLPPQIWAAVADQPLPLGVVQALVLVSAWPLMLRAAKDPSPFFTSIATNACFLLGLHTGRGDHPEFALPSFPMRVTDEEALFVWAGLNIISNSVAGYSGYPSTGQLFNKATERILDGSSPIEASPYFKAQLKAAMFSSRLQKTLYAYVEEAAGVSHHVIAVLEEEFETSQRAFALDPGDLNRFTQLCTLLEIQVCYFMPLPDFNLAILKQNILKAYTTAQRVVRLALQLQQDIRHLEHAPHHVSRHVLSALCVTMLVARSPFLVAADEQQQQHSSDDDAAATAAATVGSITTNRDAAVRDGIRAFRACSVLEGDIASRISKMIESYWSVSHLLPPVEIPLLGASHHTQKLSSSLTYECLRRWRRDMEQGRPAAVAAAAAALGAATAAAEPTGPLRRPSDNGTLTTTTTTTTGGLDPSSSAPDLSDPFQKIDWDAFMDFDWSSAPDYPLLT